MREKSPILLWLDDERNPLDEKWRVFFPVANPSIVWVKSYTDFVNWISDHGLPDAICFDHDLGEDRSGFDAAKWLTEYCLARKKSLPFWSSQSANPIGRQNILSILETYRTLTP